MAEGANAAHSTTRQEMTRLTPDQALARIGEWRCRDVRWEELDGGITNHNYLVWVDGGPEYGGAKYVLRIPGTGTDMFIDRAVERDCMVQAAEVGVAPQVAYQIDPEGALIIEFVEGQIMHPETIAGHRRRIIQAVSTVRRLHDQATFKHHINVFQMLRDYHSVARRVGASIPPRLEAMLPFLDEIEEAVGRAPVRLVACHNDLLSENFLVDRSGKMWVIDWEYGGMADPYFDLGDFVMEHPFSRHEEHLIIATYCGHASERYFARMVLYKAVSAIWWAMWAMIQLAVSEIDFDYMTWGMERVRRAERVVSDPAYSNWLMEA